MKGAKPKLTTANRGNIASLPLHEEPQAIHFARAKSLLPAHLTPAECEIWNAQAPELVRLGRLKPHFATAFAEYCIILNRLITARRELDKQEWHLVTGGRNGEQHRSRPAVAQYNDDWRKYNSLVSKFGLTPTDERSMQTGQSDLFDGFDDF